MSKRIIFQRCPSYCIANHSACIFIQEIRTYPRLLMAAFYINCVYTALTIIGLIITL